MPNADGNGSELSAPQAGLRLLIEVYAIVCWGVVGWNVTDGPVRWMLVVALPFVAAVVWGTFRAPGDHSANGGAPVAVPGVVRLLIELDLLLGAAILTVLVGQVAVGVVLAAAVIVHYATTMPRNRWLLAQHTVDRRDRDRAVE